MTAFLVKDGRVKEWKGDFATVCLSPDVWHAEDTPDERILTFAIPNGP